MKHVCAAAALTAATAVAPMLVAGAPLAGAATRAASNANTVVAQAKQFIKQHEGIDTRWTGPTTGPTIAPHKSVVVVVSQADNTAAEEYANDIKAAGKAIGWNVTVLDGQGTESGWVSAFDAAIARRPDGIVTDCDITDLVPQLKEAAARGITVVGIHASSLPQPYPSYHLFYNEESDPQQIGQAIADWAIASSDGHARVVILYDDEYQISRVKEAAIKAQILKCKTCKLLAVTSSPIADAATDIPPLATRWWSEYGKGTYVLTIADTYFDYAASTLRSIGVPHNGINLVGSDGTASAYQRIRDGQYETATIPEPWGLFGYEAIDELNRAFHHLRPDEYKPDVYVVSKGDINLEGGKRDQFIPSDNYAAHYLAIWKPRGK